MISVSWSLTRQSHGEQPYWAAIFLLVLLVTLENPVVELDLGTVL